MKYSNPRMHAEIPGWPFGAKLRTTATFTVEQHPTRGERVVRTTVDPRNGRVSKPKTLTYSRVQRIVDGDDGKTYILCHSMYMSVSVMQSNMQYQQEYIGAPDPKYFDLVALINS